MSDSDPGPASLAAMARTFPVRTALLTAGPLLLAFAQGLNSLFTSLPAGYAAAFAAAMCLFSAVVTRYHLSAFRAARLEGRWVEDAGA